ncbi:MAG: GNAT family N-acetyltransferase [Cyanobacteria bacterium REEB67]|nr:GNAT family N-acetyltransferase [Cyanobacteria bacterium REEB67]
MQAKTSDYHVLDSLKDGRTVLVRALTPADRCLLVEGLQHLSVQSLYFRFFIFKDSLSEKELDYFSNVDFVNHVALIAGFYKDGIFSPAGTGRYIVSAETGARALPGRPKRAEFALTVAEEYQRLGFGTILLRHLAAIAAEAGIEELYGLVLPENVNMLNLLRRSGFKYRRSLNAASEWEFTIDLKALPGEGTNPKG